MPTKKKPTKNNFLMYRNKPLVRCGDIIYYGNMSDKYIIMLQILSASPVGDMSVANRVSVSLQYTANDLKAKDKTIKKTEKDGLYNALDIGAIWLDRSLTGN
jgi:hypothetical protein